MPNCDAVRAHEVHLFVPGRLDVLIEQETRFRIDIRAVPTAPEETARDLIRTSVAFLEFFHFSAVFAEVATRVGAKTVRDTLADATAICHAVLALTNLQPQQVLAENAGLVERLPRNTSESMDRSLPALATIVSAADSIARSYPLEELTQLANRLDLHEHSARAQAAVDGLSRFIKRNDPWIDPKLKAIGPRYAEGALSGDEAAQLLRLEVRDVVARLEELGYTRPLEHLGLKEDARATLYERLRESRLNREGKPAATPARIVRDVIATQRIEGIDARPWIEPKLM